MNKEEYETKVGEIRTRIQRLEEELNELKKQENTLTIDFINKEINQVKPELSNEEKRELEMLDSIEKIILEYDTKRESSFMAKAIDSKGIRLYASLNDMNKEDKNEIEGILYLLLGKLALSSSIDEGYIASLNAAKDCSYIVNGLSTFSMIVIAKEKTYAFAEGKSNIYTYMNGKIQKFELKNRYCELNYEVLNNDDYYKLVLLSKSDIQDLTDQKVKIITNKTNREDLIKELI